MAVFTFQSEDDLLNYIQDNVLTYSEAMEILGISVSRLNKLVKDGKLTTIKGEGKTHLFYKPLIEAKRIELEELRRKYRPFEYE